MKNFKKKAFYFIGLSLLIIFIIKLIGAIKSNNQGIRETLPSEYKISTEDSSLIHKYYNANFKVLEVFKSKVRNPISIVKLENQYLLFYKIDASKNISIESLIKYSEADPEISTGYSYRVINLNNYKIDYKQGRPDSLSTLLLECDAKQIKKKYESDSIADLQMKCTGIAISNNSKSPVDFLCLYKKHIFKVDYIPINLKLIRQKDYLYIFILLPVSDSE